MENYLYNGVELPDINTVYNTDNSMATPTRFPYVSIYKDTNEKYYLIGNSTKFTYDNGISGGSYSYHFRFELVNDIWTLRQSNPSSPDTNTFFISWTTGTGIWSNHDILKTNGTVYLAGSEPVPVGGNTFDTRSFQIGIAVGLGLKGNFESAIDTGINEAFTKGVEVGQRLKLRDGSFIGAILVDGTLIATNIPTLSDDGVLIFPKTPTLAPNGTLIL